MNFFLKILRKFGIISSMENLRTVEEIVSGLNESTRILGEKWIPIPGVQALTSVDRTSDINISFKLGSGVLIKGFVNKTTGEMKLFPAKMLGFPKNDI